MGKFLGLIRMFLNVIQGILLEDRAALASEDAEVVRKVNVRRRAVEETTRVTGRLQVVEETTRVTGRLQVALTEGV
jgi:hypothetical protein